jgi:hypothetical protein
MASEKNANAARPCYPSITSFRSSIRFLLERELGAIGREPRDVVILAIDGIPHELAVAHWKYAETSKMTSVFPTTSSTCWLSSLTGTNVSAHGIPGVAFRVANEELVNVFEYAGDLHVPMTGNVFSDAAAVGYEPWSILGDLEPYDCSWRTELLRDSRTLRGHRFYTDPKLKCPEQICSVLRNVINPSIRGKSHRQARLLWCFIDADQHIHKNGYDKDIICFLNEIEKLALELKDQGVLIIAHSDHGLVRTTHSCELQKYFEHLLARYACSMGGAGRTRWLYVQSDRRNELWTELDRHMRSVMRVCASDEMFEKGSVAQKRVGEIVLIAESENCLTFSGHQFDHGSLLEVEVHVPLSQWPR